MHGWAIEEFLKSQLKNKRAYARKHGFLQDIANLVIEASDLDDDIDMESGNAGGPGEDEDEVDESGGSQQEEDDDESGSDEDSDMAPAASDGPAASDDAGIY
jgi:hypothetical protein